MDYSMLVGPFSDLKLFVFFSFFLPVEPSAVLSRINTFSVGCGAF